MVPIVYTLTNIYMGNIHDNNFNHALVRLKQRTELGNLQPWYAGSLTSVTRPQSCMFSLYWGHFLIGQAEFEI